MVKERVATRYELLDKIGAGGAAVVYRAHDARLDRTVALKVLREELASDPQFVERFEREARLAARLNHPNLAAIHREAATYVDKILKGSKPADLPIELPMTYDFVLNRKTAQALGLTIPHGILIQLTDMIE